jgi:hypothetical protein
MSTGPSAASAWLAAPVAARQPARHRHRAGEEGLLEAYWQAGCHHRLQNPAASPAFLAEGDGLGGPAASRAVEGASDVFHAGAAVVRQDLGHGNGPGCRAVRVAAMGDHAEADKLLQGGGEQGAGP